MIKKIQKIEDATNLALLTAAKLQYLHISPKVAISWMPEILSLKPVLRNLITIRSASEFFNQRARGR